MPKKKEKSRYEKEVRRRDIEKPHGVWLRNDIWVNLKTYAAQHETTVKYVLNSLLYDFLLKSDLERKTGMACPYEETTWDPDRGTLRKDERDSYIKEDE